jgi:ABC-type nitrate/sulfonate/bicarbonate transport system substrate-binding protein
VNVDVRDVPLLMAFDTLVKDGYLVEKTYLTSSTLITDALARGDVDIAMANTQTAWSAIAKGAPITTVVESVRPTNVLVAHERIESCRDLHDREVGVPTTTGFSPLLLDLFLARECPGTRPRFLVLPEANARAAAVIGGRVEAASMPVDDFLRIRQQSASPLHVLMSQATDFPDVKIETLHVRRDWARANPRVVEALIRAQLQAYRLVAAEPTVLYREAVSRLAIDPAAAKLAADTHLAAGIWDGNGGLTAANVQSTIEFLVKADGLAAGTTAESVSDLSYLRAVLDEIGRVP